MLKQVSLLRRNPNLSTAAFREYYETVHARIGEKYLSGRVVRYMRRYLNPMVDEQDGADVEPAYDVLMEIWYADHAAFTATMAYLALPGPAAEIAADEEHLFDRRRNRFFTVEEHESNVD